MFRRFFICLFVTLVGLLSTNVVQSRQPVIPSRNIEISLTFQSNPELGKEFVVIFTFTPRENIDHDNDLDDEANIKLSKGIRLISGETSWVGRLQKDRTQTLQLVLKATTPGFHIISAVVRSCRVDQTLAPPNSRTTCFGDVFEYTNPIVKSFWIGERDHKREISSIDLETGETSRIRVDTRSAPPGGLRPRFAEWPPRSRIDATQGRSPSVGGEEEYGFQIGKCNQTHDSVRVCDVGDVTTGRGISFLLFLFDQSRDRVVQPEWRCEPENSCEIVGQRNGRVRVTCWQEAGNCVIVGIYNAVEYRIGISVITSYHISGRFRYVDNWGYTQDMQEMLVYSEYESGGNWVFESYTHTDENGNFEVYTSGHDLMRFFVWSYHWISDVDQAGYVFCTDGHLDPEDPQWYLYIFGPVYQNVYEDFEIPEQETTNETADAGAFHIMNVIRQGYNHAIDIVSWVDRPHFCYTYWDNTDTEVLTLYKRLYLPGEDSVGIIEIQGEAATYHQDQWDDGVVMHEYGHFIMDWYAQLPPGSGDPGHQYEVPSGNFPTRVAFSEGWAHFFSCAARSDFIIISQISNLYNDNTTAWRYDLEVPQPDVPYYDQGWDQQGPSETSPIYNGYTVEGAIAEVLWDIFDIMDDGDYWYSGAIWGHNDDYNSGEGWNGAATIWDVLLNYNPNPSDPGHYRCYDFYEFRDGWIFRHEFDFDQVFQDLLNAHNVDPFGTGVEEEEYFLAARAFALAQNYPNPFNPSTRIEFDLPKTGPAKLYIYNVLGQKVATLLDQDLVAGRHVIFWDGTDDKKEEVASGIYFYRLTAGDFTGTKKMAILK